MLTALILWREDEGLTPSGAGCVGVGVLLILCGLATKVVADRKPPPPPPPPPPAAAPAAAPSVAGPVVGSLLALLVAGGLGYAAFHYGLCAAGGMSAAYSRVSTMVGGEGGRASSTTAREALVDHPIFAGSGDKAAGAEAEYSQLA